MTQTRNLFRFGSTRLLTAVAAIAIASTFPSAVYAQTSEDPASAAVSATIDHQTTVYKQIEVNGVEIAYREAGDPTKPTILLLHGFPTSSHMFRELIPNLSEHFHVLAPDFPGFGASDMPPMSEFEYSFANIATTMDAFVKAKNVSEFTLYSMDYGAPISYRMFDMDPARVKGFIIQNGNAYEEGLKDFWNPFRTFWADPSPENEKPLRGFLEIDAQVWQYTHGVPDAALPLVSPDNWHHDQYLLDREGAKDIQIQLFKSYATNLPLYAKWQEQFRRHQPPALIVWGKHDYIFPESGAHPYKRDLDNVEMHILDAGHFVLETHLDFVSTEIIDFMNREVASSGN